MQNRSLPEKLSTLPEEAGKVIKAVCGGKYSLLIDDKNQIYIFGLNSTAQLGLGHNNKVLSPVNLKLWFKYNISNWIFCIFLKLKKLEIW